VAQEISWGISFFSSSLLSQQGPDFRAIADASLPLTDKKKTFKQ
jgi:hypothetical protein